MSKEFQYMIQTPDNEMHLVDGKTDDEAKALLSVLLDAKFTPDEMTIFDKMPINTELPKPPDYY